MAPYQHDPNLDKPHTDSYGLMHSPLMKGFIIGVVIFGTIFFVAPAILYATFVLMSSGGHS